jgi:hypothetical protein
MSFSPWIKLEYTTPDKPEVIAMGARLRIRDSDAIVGKLLRLWIWADQNSIDGHEIAITREFIDRLTNCRGFAAALESVGWLIDREGLLTFPRFDRHNGDSAKKRAYETRKKHGQRSRDKRDGGGDPKGDKCPAPTGTNVPPAKGTSRGTKPGPEEEEEEESTTTTAREAESLLAACPRPSHDRPALEAAADCLRRHRPAFGFDKILAAVREVTAAVKDWPDDERLAYLPTAANFFRDDLWRRHPEEWKSRRDPRKRLSANGKPSLTDDERAARLGGRA